MMKTFLITVALIIALCAAFYYIPTDLHTKTLSTLGFAPPKEPDALKQAIGNTALPQDPAKRREALLGALKKKVTDIQSSGSAVNPAKTIQELSQSSQAIITALEQANTDSGLGAQIKQRLLDTLLPAPHTTSSPEACITPASP